jgi:hypothetical protein
MHKSEFEWRDAAAGAKAAIAQQQAGAEFYRLAAPINRS